MSIINELEKHLNESRNLSVKQKKEITTWAKDKFARGGTVHISEMPEALYDKIYNMNPHETFDSNANRLIHDIHAEERYGKKKEDK
jgi:hypothetical protein